MKQERKTVGRIISGGQTGVDRAALDIALALGIDCGGWCPLGRRAEDGPIPARYPLAETETDSYRERTFRNVRDSDATLILTWGAPSGGTRRTVSYAATLRRPGLVLDLTAEDASSAVERARAWLEAERPDILNVAGPRESTRAGAYVEATLVLEQVLSA